jgi:MYND finger
MKLTHALHRQRRTPCFPQIDLTLRAILFEKRPPFIILFSHQTTSYSQILFTNPLFVPAEEIFYDFPSGCPNPCCTDDCEMIRFPRRGLEGAAVLAIKRGGRYGRRVKAREMCNWIDCDVCFNGEQEHTTDGSEGSQSSGESGEMMLRVSGQTCSKCKLVKYCSPDHQKKDWSEHRRVCVKPL